MTKPTSIHHRNPSDRPVFRGYKILSYCNLRQIANTARLTWGDKCYSQDRDFLSRASEAASLLQEKAYRAGHRSDFSKGKFFAAANLAVRAHVNNAGDPIRRKAGERELYVYHMLRIQERLAQSDVPYLGGDAYVAAWLHDTVEDTSLGLENIERIFGRRVSGIVQALTNLKTSKQETKLQQAGRYEPRFIRSTMEYLEALYIKMADLNDYFETCKDLSSVSKFHHFRFIDEVVFPLAVSVVGAREMAVAVANKAMAVAHPDYAKYSARLEEIQFEPALEEPANLIAELLANNGLQAEIRPVLRSPYEMLLKDRTESAEGRWLFRRQERRLESFIQPPTSERPAHSFSDRELIFFDVIANDLPACYQIHNLLMGSDNFRGQLLSGRDRDFIAHPKPNHYRALHGEFGGGPPIRFRIFSREMEKVNRLGLAVSLLTPSGMSPLSSPLLSEGTLNRAQSTDREGRRQLLQRLPSIREITVNASHGGKSTQLRQVLVDQRSNWFEVAAACGPNYALRLVSGQVGVSVFDGQKLGDSFHWSNGQEVALALATRAVGRDVYSLIRDPYPRAQIKAFVSSWPLRDQVNLGKKMVITEIYAGKKRDLRLFNFMDLYFQLCDSCIESEPWFDEGVAFLERFFNIRWSSADDFYRQLAVGRASLPNVIGSFYQTYSNNP